MLHSRLTRQPPAEKQQQAKSGQGQGGNERNEHGCGHGRNGGNYMVGPLLHLVKRWRSVHSNQEILFLSSSHLGSKTHHSTIAGDEHTRNDAGVAPASLSNVDALNSTDHSAN